MFFLCASVTIEMVVTSQIAIGYGSAGKRSTAYSSTRTATQTHGLYGHKACLQASSLLHTALHAPPHKDTGLKSRGMPRSIRHEARGVRALAHVRLYSADTRPHAAHVCIVCAVKNALNAHVGDDVLPGVAGHSHQVVGEIAAARRTEAVLLQIEALRRTPA